MRPAHARLLAALFLGLGIAVAVQIVIRLGAAPRDILAFAGPQVHTLALGLMVASFCCRAWRAQVLARGTATRIRFGTALLMQTVGEAASAVTPARAGGQPAKLLVLRRDRVRAGAAAALLLGEALAEALLLVPLVLLAAFLFPDAHTAIVGAAVYALVVMATSAGAVLLAHGARRAPPSGLLPRVVGARRWRRLRVVARLFVRRSRSLLQLRPLPVSLIAVLTLAHMAARLAVLPVLAHAEASSGSLGPLVAWPLLLLYGGAVLPPPGGGGIIEGSFALGLASALPPGRLAAALVWWRVYTFYLGALAGAVSLVAGARLLRPPAPGAA